MEQIEGKNYLTIPEVMERLNVCRQTVLRYRLSKKLDFIRLRGKIYITEESYKSLFIPESEKNKTSTLWGSCLCLSKHVQYTVFKCINKVRF